MTEVKIEKQTLFKFQMSQYKNPLAIVFDLTRNEVVVATNDIDHAFEQARLYSITGNKLIIQAVDAEIIKEMKYATKTYL